MTRTFATLTIILISMLAAMGLAGWFRLSLYSASVNAPTMIFTLTVADSVHVLVNMFQQMGLGKTKHEAIAESLRINLQPMFLASITTATAFLTMNFSGAAPSRDLCNIVSMGVMAGFVYSPVCLTIPHGRPSPARDGKTREDRLPQLRQCGELCL